MSSFKGLSTTFRLKEQRPSETSLLAEDAELANEPAELNDHSDTFFVGANPMDEEGIFERGLAWSDSDED